MRRTDYRKRVGTVTRERSQHLRTNSTFPEQLLWSMLRRRQLGGLRFRRQHPIEPYVVDFYCASVRLAIELDGRSHDGRAAHDESRSQYLKNQRIRVLRIANDDVLTNLDGVLELIAGAAGVRPDGMSGDNAGV